MLKIGFDGFRSSYAFFHVGLLHVQDLLGLFFGFLGLPDACHAGAFISCSLRK